jgi:hypothetical protein
MMDNAIKPIIDEMISSVVKIKSDAIFMEDGYPILSEADRLMRFIEAISRKFYSMEWEKQRGGKS